MRELGPDRLSGDNTSLVARDLQTGEEFRLAIDEQFTRLLALAEQRRTAASAPSREKTMSSLSPREIQTRIRRGESVAEVAQIAGVPTEQIDGFATPVLAERSYMAEQARTTPLRRKHVGGAPVALGSIIDERLVDDGVTPEDALWDAWRREDGRWTVSVTAGDDQAAHFIFDVKSRYVLPADEIAHGLVGDVAHPDEPSDMALADAVRATDQHEAVLSPAEVLAETDAIHAPVASLKEARDRRAMEKQNSSSASTTFPGQYTIDDQLHFDDDQPGETAEAHQEDPPADTPTAAAPATDEDAHVDEDASSEQPDPTAGNQERRKHERRRVPSWDEIMFGGRDA